MVMLKTAVGQVVEVILNCVFAKYPDMHMFLFLLFCVLFKKIRLLLEFLAEAIT